LESGERNLMGEHSFAHSRSEHLRRHLVVAGLQVPGRHTSRFGDFVFDREPDSSVLWTPWQRVEVFNSFRQAEYAGLVDQGEARAMIRMLEQEVRVGYWPHVEFDWTDAVRTACELSAEHSLKRTVRSMDLFHVAIAAEVAADAFLSFDSDQNALAPGCGIRSCPT
jgi:predicted nucleic acid-binding protein